MRFRGPTLFRAALVLAALLAPAGARAQAVPAAAAAPDTGLQVVLVTMGQGDMVWEKFGHNALWIYDPAAGVDQVYNYGLFDFNSPGYWSRFMKGNWLYQVGATDMGRTIWQYQYLNRSVHAQWLNLTPAQKLEIKRFLEWNVQPENREYLYDYYRDNCSTRIRDALDRALGGQLRAAVGDSVTPTTYRSHSYRLVADDRPTYFGLAGGLGPAADRPITLWEEMFLPSKVQEGVRKVRVRDASGALVPLVAREQVLYAADGRAPERAEAPFRIPWYLAAGVAIAGVLALLAARARTSGAARFGFSAVSALWLLFAGTGGVVLLSLWAFTNHAIAYRNENLLQLSPLALPLVLLLPTLAYGARWSAKWAVRLALAVAALSVLGFVLQVLPGIDQGNGEMIALALPVNLALAWAARRLAGSLPERGAEPKRAEAKRPAVSTA
jgi:hypothetical protein